jgi:hypothetical protein
VTGTLARAGDALFSDDHFVAAGRLVGVGWLFAGMLVLYLAVRRFDIGWPYAAAAAALVPLCPGVLQASSTITNDAPAVLCGATALYLLAGVLITGRIGWVAPVLVTLLATATKVLNALPMLLLACVLLVLAFRRRRAGQSRESVRFAVIAIAIGITFLAVFKGWALFQSGRGQDGWVNPVLGTSGRPIGGNPINELLSTTFTGFPLVNGYYLPPQLNGELMTIWVSLFGVLIVASSFLAIAALPARTPQWAVGLTLLGGILLYPLLVELQVWVESSMYFPVVSPRYGMTLIPLALACLAFVAYRRRLRSATIFLTGFGLLATFLTTAGLTAIG